MGLPAREAVSKQFEIVENKPVSSCFNGMHVRTYVKMFALWKPGQYAIFKVQVKFFEGTSHLGQ